MNKNINLCEILKDCPKNTKFYSPIYGIVKFVEIAPSQCPICIKTITKSNKTFSVCLTQEGYNNNYYDNQECIIFPSKSQRDWSKWKCSKPNKSKFDPKTLKPFDRVLVRDNSIENWGVAFFSHIQYDFSEDKSDFIIATTGSCDFSYCIPYNKDTKYLIGTSDKAPKYYRYWED